MNKKDFTIEFLSDWHIGSGLGSGPNADSLVLRNHHGLPYVPGKTIKGLLRDACFSMHEAQPQLINENVISEIFGMGAGEGAMLDGKVFFANAELLETNILKSKPDLIPHLYRNVSRTSINENGTAVAGSLRTIEVCVPLKLQGYLTGCDEQSYQLIGNAMKWIRAIGLNRNRGLGRCMVYFNNQ